MTMSLNDIVNNILGESDPVQAKFSYSLHNPGIPFESLLASIILLLDSYGVKHSLARDPGDIGSVQTGNAKQDEAFMIEYLNFKTFLDNLSREYNTVECGLQGSTVHVYMTFSCR
jgi:hypothetical protein